jgi:hypothetical protein
MENEARLSRLLAMQCVVREGWLVKEMHDEK